MINSIQHFQEKGVKNLTEIFSSKMKFLVTIRMTLPSLQKWFME